MRLLSNLIKYPFVNMQGKEAKVIQYESDEKNFVPFGQKKKVMLKSLDEVEKEKELRMAEEEEKNDEFSAGVPVTNFDEFFKQKSEELDREAATIVEHAGEEAREIIQQAKERADAVREDARQEGLALGREEGLRAAQEEIEQMKVELANRKKQQEQEYANMIQRTEGQYVEILCSLIRKLTGVLVSDRKDVILHLIRSGIADMEPAKHYTLRVCTEDLLYIESNKEEIVEKTGITGTLEVQEEKGLTEGECIIETDRQMIDCGFQTQLENLISTLRMLV